MAEGERATGTPNTIYDLSSVLFHALEGGASYDTYIEDAEREGDRELVEFFEQVRDEDSRRADRAQQLLAERTTTAERTGGMTTGAMAGTEPEDATTMTGTAGAASTPEPSGIPPMSEDLPPPTTGETAPVAGQAPPRREEGPLGREDRASLGREDQLPREDRASLGREDPLPGEERARETEKEQDKGLIDRVRDAVLGEEEPRRREGPDRPPDRR